MNDEIRLLIATHTHGSVTPAYCQSLATATAYLGFHGLSHSTMLFEDSLVDRGRDRAAATLMENAEITHLLFIDADIEFDAKAIPRLLAMDKEFVVGAYRKKTDRGDYALAWIDENGPIEQCPETGCIRIARAGTGFMMLKRTVFERLAAAMPELCYDDHSARLAKPRAMHAFFEHVRHGRMRFSEDYEFCERWRAIGGDIWLDPQITLSHWGAHPWRGAITDLLVPVEASSSAA